MQNQSYCKNYIPTYMRVVILLSFLVCVTFCGQFLDYTPQHTFNCQKETSLGNEGLWNILILHNLDRYIFLTVCPVLIILELITLIVFSSHKELWQRPGDLVMGILLTSLVLNCHFLATAIYYSIFSDSYGDPMPASFPVFCDANGLIAIFCEILQTLYLIAMCLHIVHSLRRNLRFNQIRGLFIHLTFVILSVAGALLFWKFNLMGLNMYGTCSFKIINYTIPILASISAVVFIVLGYFSLSYFNKHMPQTSGLRLKKYRQARKYSLFIFGISIIEIINAVLEFVAMVNCWSKDPNPAVDFVVTLVNLLRLVEFMFLLYVSTNSKLFRTKLRKLARVCLCMKAPERKGSSMSNVNAQGPEQVQAQGQMIQQQLQDLLLPQGFGFTTLDALRVSQVSSIIMGILLSQMQYLSHISRTQKMRDNNYNQHIFTKYNQGALLDYNISVRNCPLINILHTSMIIFAPRMFKNMQLRDGLKDIAESFQLEANYENMFKIVQAEGGKSGEFFFFTTDNKYILKTINNEELTLLTQNLSVFDDYYNSNPNSLLAKIYGLFTFRGKQMQRTYHVILMKNILGCTRQSVERLYDMKGSSHDREVIKSNRLYNYNELKSMTLKDMDFKKLEGILRVEPDKARILHRALKLDSLFLKNLNLIDYSLLVAKVHWQQQLSQETQKFWSPIQRLKSTIQPGIYYHIGVIDYMQAWNIQKISEKWWKTLLGAEDVSAQQPDVYRIRFMDFVESIIPEETILAESEYRKTDRDQ